MNFSSEVQSQAYLTPEVSRNSTSHGIYSYAYYHNFCTYHCLFVGKNNQPSKRRLANKENDNPSKGRLAKTFKLPSLFGSKELNRKMRDPGASLNKNETAKVFRVVRDAIVAFDVDQPTTQELVCVVKQMLHKYPCLKYLPDNEAQIVMCFILLLFCTVTSFNTRLFNTQRTYHWILKRKFDRYRTSGNDEKADDEVVKRGRPRKRAKKIQSPGNVTAMEPPPGKILTLQYNLNTF